MAVGICHHTEHACSSPGPLRESALCPVVRAAPLLEFSPSIVLFSVNVFKQGESIVFFLLLWARTPHGAAFSPALDLPELRALRVRPRGLCLLSRVFTEQVPDK